MAIEKQAYCKECGDAFTYSIKWADALAVEGRQPTEYCQRCKRVHSMEKRNVAMPYFVPKPTISRVPDSELKPGRLGKLSHFERNHQTVEIAAKFHLPETDINFGIKDNDILKLIELMISHQITIVVGQTGSGKSTFLPYRLMVPPKPYPEDLFTKNGQIIVTQPRIQATRGIPAFLAKDLHGCTLGAGGDIGYVYSGEKAADRRNKLVFCTDGTLINWIASGRIVDFSIIIIDEAHERSLNIDVILGLLTNYLPLCPNLKLIIASATINSQLFIDHFKKIGKVALIEFEGENEFGYIQTFRKTLISRLPNPKLLIPAIVDKTYQILKENAEGVRKDPLNSGQIINAPEGDVLAFLPTVSSIEEAASRLQDRIEYDVNLRERSIEVFCLYSDQQMELQDLALRKKTSSISSKTLNTLHNIFSGKTPPGKILAFLLDKKSADETVEILSKTISSEKLDVDLKRWTPEALIDNKFLNSKHQIWIATYDELKNDNEKHFEYVIHDRRVIISTNVAETSLTVDGIVYVVDSGMILGVDWDKDSLTSIFLSKWHTQDGCKQRWGRAGRVRNGYVYCLYTEDQYDQFDPHTIPAITRSPLEQVVLTAKRAGVDEVDKFPWLEKPDLMELSRAVFSLRKSGVIDQDGDLTAHGVMISKFNQSPDAGHLLAIADRFTCAIEVATLLALIRYNLHGGILTWNDKWDGHTRRAVRKIHDSLIGNCKDDLAAYLKVFQCWFDSYQSHYNWITDEPFSKLWSHRIPAPTEAMRKSTSEDILNTFILKVKQVQSEEDLIKLVNQEKLLAEIYGFDSWLSDSKLAMKNCRREAWAKRHFVNHSTFIKAQKQRESILEPLSIGKKEVETRPIDFDNLLDRTRLVIAYAWPEFIYKKINSGFIAISDKMQKLENNFEVSVQQDSIISLCEKDVHTFVCCKRSTGHRRRDSHKAPLYVGLLAVLRKEWLDAIKLPLIDFASWIANNFPVNEGAEFPESTLTLIDQHFPLWGVYEGQISENINTESIFVGSLRPFHPPKLILETSSEGEILWSDDPSLNVESDLDEEAGDIQDISAITDPEAEDVLDGLEIENAYLEDYILIQFVHMGKGLGPIKVNADESILINELKEKYISGFFKLRRGNTTIQLLSSSEKEEAVLVERTYWLDYDVPTTFLIIISKSGNPRLQLLTGFEIENEDTAAYIRLIHAAFNQDKLSIKVNQMQYPVSIPFFERTRFLKISSGENSCQVLNSKGTILANYSGYFREGNAYSIFAIEDHLGSLRIECWSDTPSLETIIENYQPKIDLRKDSTSFLNVSGFLPFSNKIPNEGCVRVEVVKHEIKPNLRPMLQLRYQPDPTDFERFINKHSTGDEVIVSAVEIEASTKSDKTSLIVKIENYDIEVVMESTDLCFHGRYITLRSIKLSTQFPAIIEKIDKINERIYLTSLPFLEIQMSQIGDKVQSRVIERVQSGLYVSLIDVPYGCPIQLTAFVSSLDTPQSLAHFGEDDQVTVIISREKSGNYIKLEAINETLENELLKSKWEDYLNWDSESGKLSSHRKLKYDDVLSLTNLTDNPKTKRALKILYRDSNQLTAKVDMGIIFNEFKDHIEQRTVLTARVLKIKKNIAFVRIDEGVRAKVPINKIKNLTLKRLEIGDEFSVIIQSINRNTGFAEVEMPVQEILVKKYPIGSVYSGEVKRINSSGVFVEISNSMWGFAELNELSWFNIKDPNSIIKASDQVKVRIMEISENGQIALSMRLNSNDPLNKYPAGSLVMGKIIKLLEFGALVELEPGVVGLLHKSELTWKSISRPDQVVGEDQTITVRVLRVHGDPRRIDLSLKQAYQIFMQIPISKIGKFIGSRGSNIYQIKSETDTQIEIDQNGKINILASDNDKINKAKDRIIACIPQAKEIINY